jgi:hypothetical protein
MKFKSILAIVVASVFASCSQEHLDPLTGKYTAPTPYEFTSLANQSIEKLTGKRIFTVEVATSGVSGSEGSYTGTGEVLHMELVGDAYYLQSTAFTPGADAASAVKNQYVVGTATSGTRLFKVSGGSATAEPVKSGSITVSANGTVYTITGNLWLESGEVIKISFRGEIVYEEDIETIALTNLFAFTNNVANGTNSVTIKIATGGMTGVPNPMTGGMTWTGSGNYLAMDIYSADGTLSPGTYTPVESTALAPNTFVKGYDFDASVWGMAGVIFPNWGTCWFTVASGVETGAHLDSGTVVVTKSGDTYTIEGNFGAFKAVYTGPLAL